MKDVVFTHNKFLAILFFFFLAQVLPVTVEVTFVQCDFLIVSLVFTTVGFHRFVSSPTNWSKKIFQCVTNLNNVFNNFCSNKQMVIYVIYHSSHDLMSFAMCHVLVKLINSQYKTGELLGKNEQLKHTEFRI